MKYFFITLLVLILGVVVAIPFYLGPDDLRRCGQSPDDTAHPCTAASAIVVLSGGDTPARTAEAVELYDNGWAPYLIFSGAAYDTSGPSNALTMKRQAIAAGVPETAILIDEVSRTTAENAAQTKELVRHATADSAKEIILVTSAYHQRRAYLEFRAIHKDMTLVINHPVARDKQWGPQWWLTPSGWWLVGSELAKIIGYYSGAPNR